MACRTIAAGPGMTVITCGGRDTRRRCSGCGNHAAFACDFPVQRRDPSASKTCDRAICERCRVQQGPDKDFCPPHDRLAKASKETAP